MAAGSITGSMSTHQIAARKYAYQVLLIDEFQRHGVEVVFLNRSLGESPEDQLFLQVQGMVAEYERAKLMERCRRGKLHTARQGCVNALAAAPYGYRYIRKADGGGVARFDVVLEEAHIAQFRSSSGSVASGFPWARSAVGSRPRAFARKRAERTGTAKRSSTCCGILPTRARPCTAGTKRARGGPVSDRPGDRPNSRVGLTLTTRPRARAFPSPSRRGQ